MKTYPVPQAISISQHQLELLRHAIFLMLMSLLTITVFAAPGLPEETAKSSSPSITIHQQKIVLQWSASDEKSISHYIIERSTNGNEYTDIASVFTGESPSLVQQYNFQENIPTASGTFYYRLKTVSVNGSFSYSDTRIIKAGQQTGDYLISLHPRSDTGQEIASQMNWQNKSVNLTSFGQNGQSVKVLMINNTVSEESVATH